MFSSGTFGEIAKHTCSTFHAEPSLTISPTVLFYQFLQKTFQPCKSRAIENPRVPGRARDLRRPPRSKCSSHVVRWSGLAWWWLSVRESLGLDQMQGHPETDRLQPRGMPDIAVTRGAWRRHSSNTVRTSSSGSLPGSTMKPIYGHILYQPGRRRV